MTHPPIPALSTSSIESWGHRNTTVNTMPGVMEIPDWIGMAPNPARASTRASQPTVLPRSGPVMIRAIQATNQITSKASIVSAKCENAFSNSFVNSGFSETAAWVQVKFYVCIRNIFLNYATGEQKGIIPTIYTDSEPPSRLSNSLMPPLPWDTVGAKISKRYFSYRYPLLKADCYL